MKKLYCLLSLFILTMVFFALPVYAESNVVRVSRADSSDIRKFPILEPDNVPDGYKLAFVNYLTLGLNNTPYNPAYIYVTYMPSNCDYIIIPDTIGSDGVVIGNRDVYLSGHSSDGNVVRPFTAMYRYESIDPDTGRTNTLEDHYTLTSNGISGSYTNQYVFYNELFMTAKRTNGDDFYKPSALTLSYLLDDDLKFHFTATVTSDGQPYKLTYFAVPSSVSFPSYLAKPVTYNYSRFLVEADGTTGFRWIQENFPLLVRDLGRNIFNNTVWDIGDDIQEDYTPYGEYYYWSAGDERAKPYSINDFEITDYTNDYQILGGFDLTGPSQIVNRPQFTLNVPGMDIKNHLHGLYDYDNIAVIAVLEMNNSTEIARFDFSRSEVKSLKHTPNYIVSPINTIDLPEDSTGEVEDLQSLAEYLRYVYNTTNNNNYITYNNTIADLQSIPWDDYIATGIANGFANFMPNLSAEFDSLFGSLFDDFGVDFTIPSDSDLEAMQQLVDDAEDRFDQKTYWRVQIHNEVHYIITTCITAGDDPPVFNADMSDYHDIGFVTLFDARQIDSDTRDSVKEVITVFCSIGLVFYIFKTLPGTIGRTPNE